MNAVDAEIILGGMQKLGVGRNKKHLICAVGQLFFLRTQNRPLSYMIGFFNSSTNHVTMLEKVVTNRSLIGHNSMFFAFSAYFSYLECTYNVNFQRKQHRPE